MLLLKTHTWPIWNNRLNKWALLALHRAPWPLGLILPHELSARTLGCYHRKGWPTALQQPHLTTPRQRSCREAPGLFSHTWFLGQLKKKLWEVQNGSQAPMSWHLHSCVPSTCQADITSSSTGFWRTTFSVKQGSEVQAKKPKEIYRYMVKARSVSQAPNERENAERKGVHWTLPVRGSSQTASTPSLLCTDRGLVAELASCSPCLFFSLPSHTFVLWFPASLAIS